ncbi:Crp/Fnr family transcriptional regulator (plasmid) [Mesorhizobium atlanticum]|uniref:Crp/Fnr family transcriptional regulator n=1 Tax=Mesorhizobium atlanticum TaxID=2233532 RepID=UPI00370485A5
MNRTISSARPHIRIRAADPWLAEHGAEPDHIPLSLSDQAELVRLADVITFETKGSYIVSQGEPAKFLCLLSDGVLMASHMLTHGDRQIVAFYWPGDLFGLAEAGVYVNSIEAVTTCKVLRFPVAALEAFFLKNPRIQHRFLIKAIHDLPQYAAPANRDGQVRCCKKAGGLSSRLLRA